LSKILEISLGIILVILGLIGGLFPILQGWVFGIPGLILLGRHIPFVRRWVHKGLDWLARAKPELARSLKEKLDRHTANRDV
jgi:uncharacterized membrane protein YbaN (DUF454 family)